MHARDRFWRIVAVAMIVGVFYVGAALHRLASNGDSTPLMQAAHAQTLVSSMTTEGHDLIITQSDDGRALYCWSFARWDKDNLQLPEFRGEVLVEP